MAHYNRPHRSFADQSKLIESRGIAITDHRRAEVWLQRIGYYRLSQYWKALVDPAGATLPGATLAHAVDLYRFDLQLRQCLFVALERIEVSLRVEVSHALGRRDVFAHRNSSHLDPKERGAHQNWLQVADQQLLDCREEWLDDFYKSWGGDVPTWMAVEAWSFSLTSRLLKLMHQNDRANIAKRFNVNPATFVSWMRACATTRNSCAHHNRLWNKPLIDQPAVPKTWEARDVQHLSASRLSETRVYAVAAIAAYLLRFVGGNQSWKSRLTAIASNFPTHTGLSLADAGFPNGWEREPLWV
jgi:abortive infection bacteriophage resistance protein